MPVIAAIFTQAKIFRQPAGVFWFCAVRQIFGDGIGGFIQIGKACFHIGAHEILDFLNPRFFDARRDIHQNNGSKGAILLALGDPAWSSGTV